MVISNDEKMLYMVGMTDDVAFTNGSTDIILWAIDTTEGKLKYSSILGGNIHDSPGGIAKTSRGTYMLGMSSTSDDLGGGNYDLVALELDYKMRNQCAKFNINKIGKDINDNDRIPVGEVQLENWPFNNV